MKKAVAIIFLIILVLAAAVLVFLFLSQKGIFQKVELPQCNTLYFNGNDKINIVFFSPKESAETYASKLFSFSPLKENSKLFNVYYIDEFVPPCEIYKGVALLCYSRELARKVAACPNDYIIVAQESGESIRSSAYMNVISINTLAPLSVLPHEFGHTFGNLAEEYVPAEIPRGSQNCASSCSKFSDEKSCFRGCSDENYYRSIENGVMRTLYSNSYGAFDENLLAEKVKKFGLAPVTGFAVSQETDCSSSIYYLIEGNYSNNAIEIISKSVENGCVGSNGAGPFNYSITLADNSVQFLGEFNAELIFTDSQASEIGQISGETFRQEGVFYLKIPVVENAKALEISAPESKISVSLADRGARPCKTAQ